MKISVTIKELPKTKDDSNMYYLKISNYKQFIEGKFERSELRNLIQIIDNGIL